MTQPPEALDAATAERVRGRFHAQTAMATIGARIAKVERGFVEIELASAPHIRQQQGFVHGGVISMILDSACGFAAFTTMPEGAEVVSVEFKINFLKPALGDLFIARGRVLRPGRNLTVCQGEVYALVGAREEAVAAMQATMASVQPR
jgi:uncharacterized protein (TIGR00369 family)